MSIPLKLFYPDHSQQEASPTAKETVSGGLTGAKVSVRPIVKYNNICKAYGDLQVLKGIDLEIAPTSALDPELVGEVLEVIKEIAAEREMAILLITHEMGFAKDVADRVLFFDEGRIIEQGPPEKIFNHLESARLRTFLSRFNRG